jgi:hypothetical protein
MYKYFGSAFLFAVSCSPAFASIYIDVAVIISGELRVTGRHTTRGEAVVRLDDRFETKSDQFGRFAFSLAYHPSNCIVTVRAREETRDVVVAGCGQRGPVGAGSPSTGFETARTEPPTGMGPSGPPGPEGPRGARQAPLGHRDRSGLLGHLGYRVRRVHRGLRVVLGQQVRRGRLDLRAGPEAPCVCLFSSVEPEAGVLPNVPTMSSSSQELAKEATPSSSKKPLSIACQLKTHSRVGPGPFVPRSDRHSSHPFWIQSSRKPTLNGTVRRV